MFGLISSQIFIILVWSVVKAFYKSEVFICARSEKPIFKQLLLDVMI